MVAFSPIVEKASITSIETVQTIQDVFRRMTVYYVQKDRQAQRVSCVNESLELFGSAISTRDGEKVGDLIAKAGVVDVLHDSHQLHRIVSYNNPKKLSSRNSPGLAFKFELTLGYIIKKVILI